MNHKTKVNTSPAIQQAENATLPLLQIKAIGQHLGDIESQTFSACALGDIAFEILDAVLITSVTIDQEVTRLDALLKSICRSLTIIQEAAELAGEALLPAPGAAA